jgi:hypothetical protein
MTEVVDREVRNHVKAALTNAVLSHERLKSHAGILQALPSNMHGSLFGELDLAELLPLGLRVWEDFVASAKVETVSVEGVDAHQLLELYFQQLPPFSDKKKSEFPDAISLLALERWQAAGGGEVYVVGGDPDIKAWCASHPRMHHVAHLKDFLDLHNRAEERLSQVAISIFEREEEAVLSAIQDAFVECNFLFAPDWEAFVENVSVASSRVDDVSVIEVNEKRFVLTLGIDIRFWADISGTRYDNPDYPEDYHMREKWTGHYDVSFEATYDLAQEAIVEIDNILFNDGNQIIVTDTDFP